MPGIILQPGITYGPVLSRRLGRSLGINLLPATHKLCSFDCAYCQYGRTLERTLDPERSELPTSFEVLIAVEKALTKSRTVETITFSGNGEPTLHPDFPEIVQGIKELRDRLRPSAKLALLSNASRISDPLIIKTMEFVDLPMLKLDAGDEKTFLLINKPVDLINFSSILLGMRQVRSLVIQSMLIDGEVANIYGDAYESWVAVIGEIRPERVHLYSADRPTASSEIMSVSPQMLIKIKDDLQTRFNLRVEAFWRT